MMEKKVAAVCTFAVVGMLFYLVSFLVIATRRHPWLVAKKLRLGALLLSFGGFAAGCTQNPVVMCYDPMPPNEFSVEQYNAQTDEILIRKSSDDTLCGTISLLSGKYFSYSLTDKNDTVVLSENLVATDGGFDEDSEKFKIPVGQLLPVGMYDLKFFTVPKDSIRESFVRTQYRLNIAE